MLNDPKHRPQVPVKERGEATFSLPVKEGDETAENGTKEKGLTQELAPYEVPKSVTAEEYANLKEDPAAQWQILVKALQLNRRGLLRIPGVTAVDLGYKIVDSSFTNQLALRVHVERKFPDESEKTIFQKRPYDFIPKCSASAATKKKFFQLKNYDVPTDVIEGDYRPVQLTEPPRPGTVLERPQESDKVNRRRRLDPLVGGISIGSPQSPSGTLGALVWDNTDGSVCILSNWHVLSGDLSLEAGIPCFQPGRLDQGKSSDVVAHLKRWSFDPQTDAAIAELNGSRHYCAGEILSQVQQITGVVPPHLGMLVQKYGRSTGFSWGFIDGLYFSSAIEYSNGVVQVFEDQIHIAPAEEGARISAPGDSGSVWVTPTTDDGYKAVGLHFAGDLPHSAFGDYALANPMNLVAERLDFSFRPRYLEIRDEAVVTVPPPIQFPLQLDLNGLGTNGHGLNGKGVHPIGVLLARLTRQGPQTEPIVSESTGGGG
jgi:endonuclease G